MRKQQEHLEPDRTWLGRLRDNLAYAIATWTFNTIATPWYRAMIDGSIRLGLATAREEARRRAS